VSRVPWTCVVFDAVHSHHCRRGRKHFAAGVRGAVEERSGDVQLDEQGLPPSAPNRLPHRRASLLPPLVIKPHGSRSPSALTRYPASSPSRAARAWCMCGCRLRSRRSSATADPRRTTALATSLSGSTRRGLRRAGQNQSSRTPSSARSAGSQSSSPVSRGCTTTSSSRSRCVADLSRLRVWLNRVQLWFWMLPAMLILGEYRFVQAADGLVVACSFAF
jgi:hypothetical protein